MTLHGKEANAREQDLLDRLDLMLATTSKAEGGLIPALQTAQELFGYVPKFAIDRIGKRMRISMAEIYGVVTFYHFFSLAPRGIYTVRVCLGTACYVLGAQSVLDAFQEHLGIEVGETTEDRIFSLEAGRCFGACGLAPVIMVNDTVHQRVRPEEVPTILAAYRQQAEQEVLAGGEL